MKKNNAGFSLIELVVFIVVMGIAITGIFFAFNTALRQSVVANPQTIVNLLAQGRMDIIVGQESINGFNAYSDICPGPAVCTLPAALSGYSIASSIATTVISGDTYHIITVSASGPQNASATIKTLVGNQ